MEIIIRRTARGVFHCFHFNSPEQNTVPSLIHNYVKNTQARIFSHTEQLKMREHEKTLRLLENSVI
jgi:hypothetical protein